MNWAEQSAAWLPLRGPGVSPPKVIGLIGDASGDAAEADEAAGGGKSHSRTVQSAEPLASVPFFIS